MSDEYVITKQGIEEAAAEISDEAVPTACRCLSERRFNADWPKIILSHCKVRPSSLESSDTK